MTLRTPPWDGWITGALRFPQKKLAAWKKSDVDARAFADWPAWIAPPFSTAFRAAHELRAVTRWNESWKRYVHTLDFVTAMVTDTRVHVRAYLSGAWFGFFGGSVAAIARSAAVFDAEGEIFFVEGGSSRGHRLRVAKGASSIDEIDLTKDAAARRACADDHALITDRSAPLPKLGTARPSRDLEAALSKYGAAWELPHPLGALHVEAGGAYDAAGPRAIPTHARGLDAEIEGTRRDAGWFDLAEHGRLTVSGGDALAVVQAASGGALQADVAERRVVETDLVDRSGARVDRIV
ncbi:MAG TPA: hypothetical protein VGM56_28135, partial [Byssovorax sp.]